VSCLVSCDLCQSVEPGQSQVNQSELRLPQHPLKLTSTTGTKATPSKGREKKSPLSFIQTAIGHFSCLAWVIWEGGRAKGELWGTKWMWLLIGVHLNSWMAWTLTNHLSNHGQKSSSLPLWARCHF